MKRRVLITGGSGLLAINCALQLRATHEILLALHTRKLCVGGVRAESTDLSTPLAIRQALDAFQPDFVIHTAAATSVEQCEADPEMARHVNVLLARNIAKACAGFGCGFVHISTDHLFNGGKIWVAEDTPVAPLNAYGATKAEAEAEVLSVHPGSLVIRTNFYGWGPPWRKSFSDVILERLRANTPVDLFADVYYTPILTDPLVSAIVDLVDGGLNGCFHVVGDERLSKYAFGVLLAREFGLDEGLVRPTSIGDLPRLVARPREMSLSNAKACAALGRKMGTAQDHLRCLRQHEVLGLREELYGLGSSVQ